MVSRQLHFVEITPDGACRKAGYAPYLDYRPPLDDEKPLLSTALAKAPQGMELENQAIAYTIEHIVPDHFKQVRVRHEASINKILTAVKDRLTKEINYWDHRAEDLRRQQQAGKNTRLPWWQARQRADDLHNRLKARLQSLNQSLKLSPAPPFVVGGALVVPLGLIAKQQGAHLFAKDTQYVEQAAMDAVMRAETRLGNQPRDVSADNCGWDIESRVKDSDQLRFIEVKGRIAGAKTVTVTRNEILASLNQPEQFILAIAIVPEAAQTDAPALYYVKHPFEREPGFGEVSVNYDLRAMVQQGKKING